MRTSQRHGGERLLAPLLVVSTHDPMVDSNVVTSPVSSDRIESERGQRIRLSVRVDCEEHH
jgi:hypothetical protein